ncbi:MAG: hypothetical protein ACYTFI_21695 [Planctomycetota bacterium]|jgi:hypothetical protein
MRFRGKDLPDRNFSGERSGLIARKRGAAVSTYREREQRRKTAGRPPVNKTKLLVFVLTIATVGLLGEGIGRLSSRPRYEPAGVRWGEPANGLRAGLELVEVNAMRSGRCALRCRLVLENAGEAPLRVLGIWHQFVRSDRPVIELTDGGEPVTCRWPWRSLRRPPAPNDYVVIPPGGSHAAEERIDLDEDEWGLDHHFNAGVAYVYRNDDEEADAVERDETGQYRRARVKGLWTGEARSGELRISRGLPDWVGVPLSVLYLLGIFGLPHLIDARIERRREAKTEPPVDGAAAEQGRV